MGRTPRLPVAVAAIVAIIAMAAAPSLAADPSPKPGNGRGADKSPETPVSVSGTIRASTDEQGRTEYSLASGGTTWTLDAGPAWWYGAAHPLAPFVGRSVTIEGTRRAGATEVDVLSIDGTAVREPGRPPWAGGPKVVGEKHPGFKPWKAERAAWKSAWLAQRRSGERVLGRAGAPGQLKPKPKPSPSAGS